jgi:hypothetical protein
VAATVIARASQAGVPARVIGTTGGASLRVRVDDALAIDVSTSDAEQVWSSAIARYFVRKAA